MNQSKGVEMDNVRLAILIVIVLSEMANAQTPPLNLRTPTTSGIAAGREFPLTFVRDQCPEFTEVKRGDKPGDLRDCRVSEFGEIGSANGQTYYYALYCLIPKLDPDTGQCDDGSFNGNYFRLRGLTIFARAASSSKARLLFERVSRDIGALRYRRPQITRGAAGTLLDIPIEVDGTGHFNESEYFLLGKNGWEPIEAQGWLEDLSGRIPTGLEIWKGVWPNLQTMRAEAGLYRQGDPNCCPTGGTARIGLAIRSGHMVIDSLTVEKAP